MLTQAHLGELCQVHGWPRVSIELRANMDRMQEKGLPIDRQLKIYTKLEAEWRTKKAS